MENLGINLIAIRSGKTKRIFSTDEIIWIEGLRNYSKIYIGGESFILSKTLKSIHEKLNSGMFKRISKQAIVNINQLVEITVEQNQSAYAVLNEDFKIRCSKQYRKILNLIEL